VERVKEWVGSTPNRTFVIYPLALLLAEAVFHGGHLSLNYWAVPILAWGYLQYRLTGKYRRRLGGGGPGTAVPPVRLVSSGVYRFTRNPMYLGHLIFLLGLALVLRSWLGSALLLLQALWFQRRVLRDEARLKELFGQDYDDYMRRVPRWVPAIG